MKMELRDDDVRVLRAVDHLAGTDGETHIKQLDRKVRRLGRDQIRYRIDRLEDQFLVETWQAEEPLRPGEFPPKKIRCTDEAADVLENTEIEEMSAEERIEQLDEQVELALDTYGEVKRQVCENRDEIDELEDRMDDIEAEISDLMAKLDRLIDEVEGDDGEDEQWGF